MEHYKADLDALTLYAWRSPQARTVQYRVRFKGDHGDGWLETETVPLTLAEQRMTLPEIMARDWLLKSAPVALPAGLL